MRIALVSPFPPLKGGIARFSGMLMPALEAAGCQVLPVPFRRLYPRWLLQGRSASDPVAPATGSTFDLLDLMNPLSWISTALAIRRARPDLVLVAYWSGLLAPLCAVFRTISGTRSVLLLHNFTSHERLPSEWLLQRLLLASADGFITLSASVSEELEASGNRKPVMTLFHPVDETRSPLPSRKEARESLGLPAGATVLLFFGYVRRYKGLDLLLEAMAIAHRRDPSLRLVVAGEFISDLSLFRDEAGRLGIDGIVDFLPGYVPADRVASLFAAADAAVLPYRSATQSGVVPLAFGHGVPVIACDAGALSTQVVHGRSGWIVGEPGPEAFAEGILEFLRCRESMPLQEGIEEARRSGSWAAFARGTMAFLESLPRGMV